MPRREFHAAYVEKFQREISLMAFKALLDRLGLRTGRTGRYEKGVVPANKGKKMAFNANSARTQFKKGQRPRSTKAAGAERVDKDGYVYISIDEVDPHTGFERCYVMKHRWLRERQHGPIPAKMVLKCKGDRSNPDPSNWELISRAVLARRNKRFGGLTLTPELESMAIAVAKLDHRLGERRRGKAA